MIRSLSVVLGLLVVVYMGCVWSMTSSSHAPETEGAPPQQRRRRKQAPQHHPPVRQGGVIQPSVLKAVATTNVQLPLLPDLSKNSTSGFLLPRASPLRILLPKQQPQPAQHPPPLFLNYQLHRNRPYNITFGQYTKCTLGITYNKWGRKPVERVALAPTFQSLLKLTTSIQTNLKLIVLGDSVGTQFFQLLEEAMGATWDDVTLYKFAWGAHESVSIAAPIQGGGVVAGFRMTGMFLKQGLGKPPPNAKGGGWLLEHTQLLLNHTYQHAISTTTDHQQQTKATTTVTKSVEKFDAIIFRIPHGWLTLDEITHDTLVESLVLSNQIFGVRTIIIMTLPVNNNVKTMEELEQLHRVNSMIRDVVDHWHEYIIESTTTTSTGIQHVLLMDFGKWAMDLTALNAKLLLGWDQETMPSSSSAAPAAANNYTLDRLGCIKFPPSIAMICTNPNVQVGDCSCRRNQLSIDGMHWCMESVGGRSLAAMACLLQCSLLWNTNTKGNRDDIKACESSCNDRFMSLKPVDQLFAT
jgi:RES domain-containing protein